MDTTLVAFVNKNQGELMELWLSRVNQNEDFAPFRSNPDAQKSKFVDLIIDHFKYAKDSDVNALNDYVEEQIHIGWTIKNFIQGIKLFKDVLFDALERDQDRSPSWMTFRTIDEWSDSFDHLLVDVYTVEWEDKITKQKLAIQELSAPLMPVAEGITVMPLIGAIDTERAKYIMENLLDGVIKHESQVVLIDITGVPIVDTMVAHHIIKAAEAVGLIGAECILVGIRPEIAQTIVNLGIDLDRFPTKSSLKKGIVEAMNRTGRQIVLIDP